MLEDAEAVAKKGSSSSSEKQRISKCETKFAKNQKSLNIDEVSSQSIGTGKTRCD